MGEPSANPIVPDLVVDDGDQPIDGRRLRRERGRTAVVDAVFDLLREGHVPPSAEEIAERSGVSVSSIFRYFPGLEDLQRQAFERFRERYAPLFDIPAAGEGTLDARVSRFVDTRIRLYSEAGPIITLARLRVLEQPAFVEAVARMQVMFDNQIALQFGPELGTLDARRADDLAASIDSVTGPAAWMQLRDQRSRNEAHIAAIWTRNIQAVVRAWAAAPTDDKAGNS